MAEALVASSDVEDGSAPMDAPVADADRILSIDVLRGVALLGILVMNIQSFAMVGAAYLNPTVMGGLEGADYWVWLFSHVLADQKFMTIFSMLFGAGVAIMAHRQSEHGRSAAALHYRRMGWLLAIGLLHAYLVWYGDILVIYAWCGCLVFLLRRLRPWRLVMLGVLSIAIPSAMYLFIGWSMPYWPEEAIHQLEEDGWSPSPEAVEAEIAVYRGPWFGQLPHRAEAAFYMETFVFLFLFGWRAGGLMLLGMALYRWGVFSATRSAAFYATSVIVGAATGIPLIVWGVHRNFAEQWRIDYSFFQGSQFNYWGSVLVSLSYVGLVMLACKMRPQTAILRPLAAVGQTALTNYLLQSILCTAIFYGHGMGQFGRFSRVEQLLTVAAVWSLQLIASPIWLRYFRFGPSEWLWRSLSYGRTQPMRR